MKPVKSDIPRSIVALSVALVSIREGNLCIGTAVDNGSSNLAPEKLAGNSGCPL
jgi:hypothetical protein